MKYRAFLSYSRADNRIAGWLHQKLDRYRTPRSLRGRPGAYGAAPARLFPVFRDRTDLSGGGELTARISEALGESEALVVLCSPSAAQSVWVNREIEAFVAGGRSDRIYPVIVSGEPESADPAKECFPPALRGRGLLAADLREIRLPDGRQVGDGRDVGALKLIAGLLGLPLDALAQRERRRQRMAAMLAGAAALVFAAVAMVAVWQSIEAGRNAEQSARNAEEAARAAVTSLVQQSVQEVRGGDYPRAFAVAADGVRQFPAHADRFLTLMRWIGFATRGEEIVHHRRSDVLDAAFSPDGRLLASVGEDDVLLVSDLVTGRSWSSSAPAGHDYVSVSLSDSHVAAVVTPVSLESDKVWQGGFADASIQEVPGDPEADADDVGEDVPMVSTILVWALGETPGPPQKFPSDVGVEMALGREQNIALSPDGRWLAGCGRDANTVYSLETGKVAWRATRAGFPTGLFSSDCAFDLDSRFLGAATTGNLRLYEAATGQVLAEESDLAFLDDRVPMTGAGRPGFDWDKVNLMVEISPGIFSPRDETGPLGICGFRQSAGPLPEPLDPVAYVYETAKDREDDVNPPRVISFRDGRTASLAQGDNLVLSPAYQDRFKACGFGLEEGGEFDAYPDRTPQAEAMIERLLKGQNAPPSEFDSVGDALVLLDDALAVEYFDGLPVAVVADQDNRIVVYDVATGERRADMQSLGRVAGLAISRDGRSLFVQTSRGAEFWDARYGVLIARIPQVDCQTYCNLVTYFAEDDRSITLTTDDMGGGWQYRFPSPSFAMSVEDLAPLLCRRLFGPGADDSLRPAACRGIFPAPILLPVDPGEKGRP